jgi:uncharacterized lipoprotein
MKKILILGTLAALLLSACSGSTNTQDRGDAGQSSLVTVYRSPT